MEGRQSEVLNGTVESWKTFIIIVHKESDVDKLGLKKSEELSPHEKCQSNETNDSAFWDSCKLQHSTLVETEVYCLNW